MRVFYFKATALSFLIAIIPIWVDAKTCCCPPKKKNNLFCTIPIEHNPSWYVEVGLGWMFNQKLGTRYLPNIDLPPDRYDAPIAKQEPMGFLSGGYVWSRQANLFPFASLGVEYSYAFPAKVSGVIEDYSDPGEANLSYEYKTAHHILLLLGKVNIYRWKNWMPYLSAGMGPTWNRFSAYSEQPISSKTFSHTNPEFPNKTKLNFACSIGAGLDYIFTKNLWGSVGYRYNHLGWEKAGNSDQEHYIGANLVNTVQVHTAILSLRYLFG